MKTETLKQRQPIGQANWKLPIDLIRVVRVEAAALGVNAASIVTQRLTESYKRRPSNVATDLDQA